MLGISKSISSERDRLDHEKNRLTCHFGAEATAKLREAIELANHSFLSISEAATHLIAKHQEECCAQRLDAKELKTLAEQMIEETAKIPTPRPVNQRRARRRKKW